MTIGINGLYLSTTLDRYKYMKVSLDAFPKHTIEPHNLLNKAKHGFVYMECRKGMCGLPQTGILANKLLK